MEPSPVLPPEAYVPLLHDGAPGLYLTWSPESPAIIIPYFKTADGIVRFLKIDGMVDPEGHGEASFSVLGPIDPNLFVGRNLGSFSYAVPQDGVLCAIRVDGRLYEARYNVTAEGFDVIEGDAGVFVNKAEVERWWSLCDEAGANPNKS